MKFQYLGWTDLKLSGIGLGTWAIGGGGWDWGWGPQDDEQSIATIHRALDLGINWIDTAPSYGLGHSEEVVGKAIKGLHEKPIIATKCGQHWDKNRNIYFDLTREKLIYEVENNLKRLGVEIIDLYQIHHPIPDEQLEEGWSALNQLILTGKIRYAGVSNFSLDQIKRLQSLQSVASLQPPFSILERGIEEKLLPYCRENNIGVIVYSPLQKGLLTGKVNKKWVEDLPNNDHRRRDPYFQEPKLTATINFVDQLKSLATPSGHSVSELAIAWTLHQQGVTAAIVGARYPKQIEETIKAGVWELEEKVIEEIENLLS